MMPRQRIPLHQQLLHEPGLRLLRSSYFSVGAGAVVFSCVELVLCPRDVIARRWAHPWLLTSILGERAPDLRREDSAVSHQCASAYSAWGACSADQAPHALHAERRTGGRGSSQCALAAYRPCTVSRGMFPPNGATWRGGRLTGSAIPTTRHRTGWPFCRCLIRMRGASSLRLTVGVSAPHRR
jgi:hypothetical protein